MIKEIERIILITILWFSKGNSEHFEDISGNSTEIQALLDYETGLIFYKDESVPACFVETFLTAFQLSEFRIPLGSSASIGVASPPLQRARGLVPLSESGLLFCKGMEIVDLEHDTALEERKEVGRSKRRKRQSYSYYRGGNNGHGGGATARSSWNSPNSASQAQVQGQVFGSGIFSGQAQSQNGGLSQSQVQLSGVGIRGQIASSSGNAQAQLNIGNGGGSGQASGLGNGPSSSQVQVTLGQAANEESMASASATSGGAVAGVGGPGFASGSGSFGGDGGVGGTGLLQHSYPSQFGGGSGTATQNGFVPGHGYYQDSRNGYAGQHGVRQNGFGGGGGRDGVYNGGYHSGSGDQSHSQRTPGIHDLQGSGIHHGSPDGFRDASQTFTGNIPGHSYSGTDTGVPTQVGRRHTGINDNIGEGISSQVGRGHGGIGGGNGASVPSINGQHTFKTSPTSSGHVSGLPYSGIPGTNGFGSGGHQPSLLYPYSASNGGRDSQGSGGIGTHRGYQIRDGGTGGQSGVPATSSLTGQDYRNGNGYRTTTTAGGQPFVQSHTPGAHASSHGIGQAQAQTVYFGGTGSSGHVPYRYYQDSQPGPGSSTVNGVSRYQDQQVGVGSAGQRQQTGIPSTSSVSYPASHTRGDIYHQTDQSGGNGGRTSSSNGYHNQQHLTNGQRGTGSLTAGSPVSSPGGQHITRGNGNERQTYTQGSYQPQITQGGTPASTTIYSNGQQRNVQSSHLTPATTTSHLPSYQPSLQSQNGHRTAPTGPIGTPQNGHSLPQTTYQQVPPPSSTVRNGQPYRINGLGQIIPAGHGRHTSSFLPSTTTTITESGIEQTGQVERGSSTISSPSLSGQSGFFPAYGVSRATPEDPEGKKCTIITFSCTIVIESNGRAKICRPNAVRVNGSNGNGGQAGSTGNGSQICCC